MSPTHKEKMRWVFAGQAMQGLLMQDHAYSDEEIISRQCVKYADGLIAKLEETAKEECDHKISLPYESKTQEFIYRDSCPKCGKVFER